MQNGSASIPAAPGRPRGPTVTARRVDASVGSRKRSWANEPDSSVGAAAVSAAPRRLRAGASAHRPPMQGRAAFARTLARRAAWFGRVCLRAPLFTQEKSDTAMRRSPTAPRVQNRNYGLALAANRQSLNVTTDATLRNTASHID